MVGKIRKVPMLATGTLMNKSIIMRYPNRRKKRLRGIPG